MAYIKVVDDPYIVGICENQDANGNISKEEYDEITELFANKPTATSGYKYMLRDDSHKWEMVESGGGL